MIVDTGADPGFPVAGGANRPEGGGQHTKLPNFPKNCMKLRKFLAGGGGGGGGAPPAAPKSANGSYIFIWDTIVLSTKYFCRSKGRYRRPGVQILSFSYNLRQKMA